MTETSRRTPSTGTTAPDRPRKPATTGDLRPPEAHADERATLLTFLQYLRDAVIRKVEDLPDEASRASPVRSGTSLLGLVRHLAAVELNWFVWAYEGPDRERWDDDLTPAEDETVASAVAAYRAAIRRADAVVAGCADLARPGARSLRETDPPSMRWILVHMIEETGRHAGHADILRELYDGAAGR
ncbi:DinB family protein [Actinacidiphila sp. ITFR-21]|uniref:DinB family protein n=1 Tax=Actinacidiphila sp. ITFR-21 TaxID=3075199 RepID=UPI002889DE85|nr:DinB family protein [Streptomyces sp. ITFR-21]WNI18646.1 DinB family protein [Streptomyces sp. ITFR-21]